MKPDKPANASNLRHRDKKRPQGLIPLANAPLTGDETQRILQKLQVHQIELEMQNEELRQARAEVEATAARYTELYDFAPVGYFTLESNGTITRANLAGALLLSLERTRLTGKPFSSFVSEADLPAFNAFLRQVFAGKTRQTCEVELGKDVQRPETVQIQATLSADTQECRAVVVVITERKDAEKKAQAAQTEAKALLERSEHSRRAMLSLLEDQRRADNKLATSYSLIKAAFDSTADGLYVVDNHGRIVQFNRKFLELWRMPAEIMESKDDKKAISFVLNQLQDPGKFLSQVKELYAQPEAVSFDLLEFKDGRIFERYSQPQKVNGKSVGRVWSFRDVTEYKQAEEELRFRNILLTTQQETSLDGILVVDENNRILSYNRRFAEMWGIPRELVESRDDRPVLQFVATKPADPQGFLTRVKYLYDHREEKSREEISLKDGRLFDRYSSPMSGPMSGSGDKYYGRIWYFSDITEQKKLEDQLRHAQKMEAIGTLAGGIAHDFNNILNVIIGYGSMVLDKNELDSSSREQMYEVLAAAERGATLTRRLLAFSRKQVADVKAVNVNEIITDLQKMLNRVIGEDIDLRIDLEERFLTVQADTGHIEQVLMNLATNARDAMPTGGHLTIETKTAQIDDEFVATHGYGRPGEYAVISVADTGGGMDVETQSKIFEPFYTTKGIGEGTGLGLAISYGIIKQHNGYLTCYSESGKGTVFKIFLPLAEDTAASGINADAPEAIRGGPETILIAEDDPSLRKLTRIVLESFGYSVIIAEDGEEAVSKFIENRDKVKLVILDLIMPKKSGKEVYEEIIKIKPEVKTLLMSGYTMDTISKMDLDKGLGVLLKPIVPKDLLNNVREAMDSPRTAR